MTMPKLIHIWKDFKIYYIENDKYMLIYNKELIKEGTAETIKNHLNSIIDLHYARLNPDKENA